MTLSFFSDFYKHIDFLCLIYFIGWWLGRCFALYFSFREGNYLTEGIQLVSNKDKILSCFWREISPSNCQSSSSIFTACCGRDGLNHSLVFESVGTFFFWDRNSLIFFMNLHRVFIRNSSRQPHFHHFICHRKDFHRVDFGPVQTFKPHFQEWFVSSKARACDFHRFLYHWARRWRAQWLNYDGGGRCFISEL